MAGVSSGMYHLSRPRRAVWIAIALSASSVFLFSLVYQLDDRPPASSARSSNSQVIWSSVRLIQAGHRCVPKIAQVFRSLDGLLYFHDHPTPFPSLDCASPPVVHPIVSLVEDAGRAWNLKLKSQSLDLRAAVSEYRRRNRRNPPKGFDRWWDWASLNGVKLLDEYDTLHRSIEPFFALSPHLFRHRVTALVTDQTKWASGIFVITIRKGRLSLSGQQADISPRPMEMIHLLKGIAHLLPDVDFPVYVEDLPAVAVSASNYQRHVQAARNSTLLSQRDLLDIKNQPEPQGWSTTCPPYSELRLKLAGLEDSSHRSFSQSYIHDPVAASDFCDHPNLVQLNGFLSVTNPKVHQFFPLGSFTKLKGFAELLLTAPSQFFQEIGHDPDWEDKEARMVWRGSTTGAVFSKNTNWRQSQRARLVMFSNRSGSNVSVRITDPRQHLKYFEADTGFLNRKYFDVGFVDSAIQCDKADGTCEEVEDDYTFKPRLNSSQTNNFKYIIDVDGNGWSGRFHRLMSTRSVILKSTIFPEWYADRIQPWYHYVPVRVDYHDLYDIMAFFLGDHNGLNHHDELGKKIGEAGHQWTKEFWRLTDMQAYMYLLILEYSRLYNRDLNDLHSMDYL